MKIKFILGALGLILITVLSGCSANTTDNNSSTPAATESVPTKTEDTSESEPETATVTVITANEAMSMMEDSSDLIILDVRTADEYADGHVAGSILLPYDEITTSSNELPEDTSTTILVYCRSGRRSAIAAQTLIDLGFTSVYDFGGIIDWPYDVVKD